MRTTLIINDAVMKHLRTEAARQHRTLSELVEAALRMLLEHSPQKSRKLLSLPRFKGGRPVVDVSNREALYRVMEEEECS